MTLPRSCVWVDMTVCQSALHTCGSYPNRRRREVCTCPPKVQDTTCYDISLLELSAASYTNTTKRLNIDNARFLRNTALTEYSFQSRPRVHCHFVRHSRNLRTLVVRTEIHVRTDDALETLDVRVDDRATEEV